MPIRYNEIGGLPGYTWVPLPDVKIGDVAFFEERDVRIVRIEITEHAFTRTEPIVYVTDIATLRPDSFQLESKTAYLLLKKRDVIEQAIQQYIAGQGLYDTAWRLHISPNVLKSRLQERGLLRDKAACDALRGKHAGESKRQFNSPFSWQDTP